MFHNRTLCTTSTVGTGTIALGQTQPGYLSFTEAGVVDGETVTYTFEDGSNIEVGRGVYASAGQTLTRAAILVSKVSGQPADTSPLSLSGAARVFLTAAAEDLVAMPDSTVDNAIMRADGTSGKRIQKSGVIIDDSGNMAFLTGTSISWNSGDVLITHSTNALAFTGASNGYSFDGPIKGSSPSGVLSDTSAVAGSAASVYFPTFFGNAGTGHVHRLNRLFVGEAAANDSITPSSVKSWVETLITNTVQNAQFASSSALGELGILGASRSSDFRTAFASATGGAQGVTGIGYNDDTTGNPIAVGMNAIGVHASGVTGITVGNQMDLNSAKAVTAITPFGGLVAGTTMAGLFTAGAYSGIGTQNASAAAVVGVGRVGGPIFQKGFIVLNGAVDTTVGAGTNGVAFEAARNQSFRWLNSGGTTDSEIWANASGLLVGSGVLPATNDGGALGSTSLKWSDAFFASGAVLNFNSGDVTITHSADTLAFAGGTSYTFDADVTFGSTISSGTGVSTGDARIELGGQRSGSGNVYIDFHATSGSDYECRFLRLGGTNGAASFSNTGTGDFSFTQEGAGALSFKISNTERYRIDTSGMPIWNPSSTTPATLGTNGQITMTLTSNTNLRFSARGSDGTTRVANLTLA